MNSKTVTYTTHTFNTNNVFVQHYKNDQNPTRPNHVLYMYVTPEELANVPESFFMVKELGEQSNRVGTLVFKYLRLDLTGKLKFPSKDIPEAFQGKLTRDTELDQVKTAIVKLIEQNPEAKIQFEFPMQGAFANVETPNDPYENQYLLYDVEQFPATFGAPTWFLKRGAEFNVTAKAEYSKNYGRNYYQISIATDAAAEDAFATGATRGAAPTLGGHTATADFSADLGSADTEAAPVNDLSGLL